MNYLNIHTDTLKSDAFIGAEPTERATWLCLLGWSVTQENGGTISNCRDWSDRKWQQLCGVTKEEVSADSRLFTFSGQNLRIAYYPKAQEDEVIKKRVTAKANGKLGGRPKKIKTNVGTNVGFENKPKLESENGNQLTQQKPTSESVKEGKEKKGNESREPNGSCRIASDAPSNLDLVWDAFPERGRRRSSRKKLHDSWKRLPAKDRPSVQTLLDAIAAWRTTEDWQKDSGEFVPALDRWIRDRKWADLPTPEIKTKAADTTLELMGGRSMSVVKLDDLPEIETKPEDDDDNPFN